MVDDDGDGDGDVDDRATHLLQIKNVRVLSKANKCIGFAGFGSQFS